ncbi:MAG: RNA 2',3'-cyclic phosphodiesterase [Psychromonas sp.]|nr:RNA 2',3'-cyclic phosphodiesterase [Psychromonas sp.]
MTKKLFLGISLDKQQCREVAQLQEHFGTDVKLVAINNLHMTLAFFGQVSSKSQRQLEKRISGMHKPAFTITLDKLVHWQKPKILCITGKTCDSALLQITKACQLLAATLNLHKSAYLFTAHITVARKAHNLGQTPVNFKPLTLKPQAIHLFESKNTDNGVEYLILRSWPLKQKKALIKRLF